MEKGKQYKNDHGDRYEVEVAYGGAGTPIPRIVHLRLVELSDKMRELPPQETIVYTESQVQEHLYEVRPR